MKRSKTFILLILGLFLICVFYSRGLYVPARTQDKQETLKIRKGILLPAPLIQRSRRLTANFRAVSTIFQENFEADTSSWVKEGEWNIGQPTSGPSSGHESPNCAGTNLSGNYSNNQNYSLISPTIVLPGLSNPASTIKLIFWEWFQLESGYDYGRVKISTDNGSSWDDMDFRDGSSDWRETVIDLTSYANQSINLAFFFYSDSSVIYPGWYVDDVRVEVQEPDPLSAMLLSLNSQNFPFIYMNVAVDYFSAPIIDLGSSNFTVYENGILQTEYFEVIPPYLGGGSRLVDIIFLMDNSGSMSGEINAVRNNVIDFVDGLSTSGVDYALGLCRFGQSADSGRPIIEENGNLTTNAEYFKNDVWARNIASGGREPGWDALYDSCTSFNFRPGTQKVFIIITDEPSNGDTHSSSDVISILQQHSVTTFALLSSSSSVTQSYIPIVEATNGSSYDIYSNFDDILTYIASQVSNTYVIRYKSSHPNLDGISRNVEVVVTKNGHTATVTGSYIPGSAPKIQRTQATLDLHNQPWDTGKEITVEVEIEDSIEPFTQSATLYYKNITDSSYLSSSMSNTSGNLWEGVIPSGFALTPGISYYIATTDGENTSSDPSVDPANNPYQIAILPNVAPSITHSSVTASITNVPISIIATIEDSTTYVAYAELAYRKIGQLTYQHIEMTHNNNTYLAEIPASFVTLGGVDYYIYAKDDFDLGSYLGTPDNPLRINVILFSTISTNPSTDETGVPVNTTVKAWFNQEIESSSINSMTTYVIPEISFTTSYDHNENRLDIIPDSNLTPGQQYTVILTDGIKSLAGDYLSRYQWSFITAYSNHRERVIAKLNEFKQEAFNTIDSQENILCDYLYDGINAMTHDQRFKLIKILADLVINIGSGASANAKLEHMYGPGSKGINAGVRQFLKMLGLIEKANIPVLEMYLSYRTRKKLGKLTELIPDWYNPLQPSPTKANIKDYLNNEYEVYAPDEATLQAIEKEEEPPPAYIGISAIKNEILNVIQNEIDSLPSEISSSQADRITNYLNAQIRYLKQANSSEVKIPNIKNNSFETITLGQITSWNDQMYWGIDNLLQEEVAFLTGTIVKALGAIIKVGGIGTSWTGLGLGAVAWGDIMIFGTWGAETAWQIFANEKLSPIAAITGAVQGSHEQLNDDALSLLDYIELCCNQTVNITFHRLKTLGITSILSSSDARSSSADLEVLSISVPPVNLEVKESETGVVSIKNNSISTYKIGLTGTILGPAISDKGKPIISFFLQKDMIEISSGSQANLEFIYSSPPTLPYGPEGFEISLSILALNNTTAEQLELGPFVERLIAGAVNEIDTSNLASSVEIFSGIINPGEWKEKEIEISPSLQSLLFTIHTAEGGEADVHIYDASGNHVGLNYSTEFIEEQIQGSEYSGSNVKGEYIRLNSPSPGLYTLKVYGRSAILPYAVTMTEVPPMPAMLSILTQPLVGRSEPGIQIDLSLLLKESGGNSDITGLSINLVHLLDSSGNEIHKDRISLSSYSSTIAKGEAQLITVTVDIPSGIPRGTYSGEFEATWSGGTQKIQVNLQVVQYALTLSATSGGTTDPSPGTYFYNPETEVTVKAITDSGYSFSEWSGDESGTDNSITITMDFDKSLKANFNATDEEKEEKKGPCFIATAAYGSLLHPYVKVLRDFRDKYLMPNKLGCILVYFYYKYSPFVADFIAKHKALKIIVRISLLPLVAFSYSMIVFGPIITVIIIFFIFLLPVFFICVYQKEIKWYRIRVRKK